MRHPFLLSVALAIGAMLSAAATQAATTLPPVKIAQVVTNDDSAKIYITPVPGAADYRVYDKSNPHFVKYAGGAAGAALKTMPRWNPTTFSWITAEKSLPCIEFNGIDPNRPVNLVVEALDAMGPYEDHALPMLSQASSSAMTNTLMQMTCNCPTCTAPNCNCGCVMSMNGHGVPGVLPKVIARSAVFRVSPTARRLTGEQAFFDKFTDSLTFVAVAEDPRLFINTSRPSRFESARWIADAYLAWDRMDEVKIFTDHNHLMTVLADGGRDWWYYPNTPEYIASGKAGKAVFIGGTAYASLTLTPKAPSPDISGNKVLHITGEWDAHNDGRRWQDIFIRPAGDAVIQPAWKEFLINPFSGQSGLIVTVDMNKIGAVQYDAQRGGAGWLVNGQLTGIKLAGYSPGVSDLDLGKTWLPCWRASADHLSPEDTRRVNWSNGNDNDNDSRHRFDIYLSQTRIKVYEEGTLKVDWTMTFPLPFTKIDVTFAQQLYHTSLEHFELTHSYHNRESLWIDRTPFTDQRHWDNMGFEVLKSMP